MCVFLQSKLCAYVRHGAKMLTHLTFTYSKVKIFTSSPYYDYFLM
jgi:hypothetical protein